jgi:hypothetical protein
MFIFESMQAKKNRLIAALILCGIAISFSFKPGLHPFYVSVCEIVIQTEKKEIQISTRLFTEDLQLELQETEGIKADLRLVTKTNEQALHRYVKKHLVLSAESAKQELQWVGYEIKEDAVWIYHQVPMNKAPKSLKVTNTCLMKSFPGQSNIIKISLNDEVQSYKLTAQESTHTFAF